MVIRNPNYFFKDFQVMIWSWKKRDEDHHKIFDFKKTALLFDFSIKYLLRRHSIIFPKLNSYIQYRIYKTINKA